MKSSDKGCLLILIVFVAVIAGIGWYLLIYDGSKSDVPSKDECLEFAEFIEDSFNSNKIDRILDESYTADIANTILRDIGNYHYGSMARDQVSSLARMLLRQVFEEIGLQTSEYEAFAFQKYRVDANGIPHLVFSYWEFDDPYYIDFKIRNVEDQITIVDFYSYHTGMHFSEILGRLVKLALSKNIGAYSGDSKALFELQKEFGKIPLIRENLLLGEADAAIELFNTIPTNIASLREMQILYLLISKFKGTEEHIKALQNIIKTDPTDGRFVDLQSIKLYALKRNGEKLRFHLKRLKTEIGEDPRLKLYEALSHEQDEDYKKAHNLYKELLKKYDEPAFHYWHLACYINQEDYNGAIKKIEFMFERDGTFSTVEEYVTVFITDFPDFAKSPEFNAWFGVDEMDRNPVIKM